MPVILCILPLKTHAQYIPVHPSSGIYEFLDELANEGIIERNSVFKPLGRKQISVLLNSAGDSLLNSRQRKELAFYLRDYNKEVYYHKNFDRRTDLFYYRDSSFSLTVNPILGGTFYYGKSRDPNTPDDNAWHWSNGAEATATYGRWGFYGSLRDNHESEFLTRPEYLNREYGGANFKRMSDGQVDYWEFRGGLSYDFGIGNIGLYKDHFEWGTNYQGANIFGGRTPSFAHLALNIKPVNWFEFRYVHGWLVSEVVDSTRSFFVSNAYGTDYRERYHGKYMAANMFSFRPVKKLYISFGNSIIYDYDNPHPAYFIPVIFFKAVDHGLSSGIDNMNSQLFLDISSRNIKYTHLYATLFLDELAMHRVFDPDEYNFYSFKGGIRISNLIPNFYAGMEYTITNALTFRHYVPTLSFESNSYNLGHYLSDNARELNLIAGYRPLRNLDISLNYIHADKGPDHTLAGTPRLGIKAFTPIVWERNAFILQARMQVLNDIYAHISFTYSDISGAETDQYTPELWKGEKTILNVGIRWGI